MYTDSREYCPYCNAYVFVEVGYSPEDFDYLFRCTQCWAMFEPYEEYEE